MALTLFILVVVMLALIGVPALIVTVLLLAVLVAGGALVIALGVALGAALLACAPLIVCGALIWLIWRLARGPRRSATIAR